MPVEFNPDNIPRYDASLLRYINENFQRLKSALAGVASSGAGSTAPDASDAKIGDTFVRTDLKIFLVFDGTDWRNVGSYEEITFAPTITQSVGVTRTVTYARYIRLGGSFIIGEVLLVPTSAGTAGQIINVSTPITPFSPVGQSVGIGYIYTGAQRVPIIPILVGTNFQFVDGARVSGAELVGVAGSNFAGSLGVGTSIHFTFQIRT